MGVSSEPQDGDIAAAVTGGNTFLERMNQLIAAKQASEKAEASLALAVSAKAILDQADGKIAEAQRVLDGANAQAKKIVTDAQRDVAILVDDANQRRAQAVNGATKIKQDADSYAETTRATAAMEMQRASATSQLADAKLATAESAEATANKKSADADAATVAANETRAKYSDALSALQTSVSKALGI